MVSGTVRYQALGPVLAGEGSRAFLGLEITDEARARPVVLVWFPEEVNANPELLERVRRETMHAAGLDHPNILRVLGHAQLDEGVARVVEYADGESLRRLLDAAGAVPARIAARLICEAATGVHYAHLAGNEDGSPLLHGDLRPETLMVSYSGLCSVSGYGALNVAPRELGGQRVRGRRLYCAPEQLVGGREAISRQTDVYLLGLTLYALIAGRHPFEEEPNFEKALLEKAPSRLPPGDVPEALQEVLERALRMKAADRYPTPLALREAIESALEASGGLPTRDEVAAFVNRVLPVNDELRAARRKAIDAGVAEFARKSWEAPAPPPAPEKPSPPPRAAPAAAAPAAPPQSAPARATPVIPIERRVTPPAIRSLKEEDQRSRAEAEARERTRLAVILSSVGVGALVLVVVLVAQGGREERGPLPGIRKAEGASGSTTPAPPTASDEPRRGEAAANQGAVPPPAAPSGPGPGPSPAAASESAAASASASASSPPTSSSIASASTALTSTRSPSPAPEPVPAPEPAKPPPEPRLELTVEPPVELSIDGKAMGRTPFSGNLPAGKHVLKLTDAALGISVTRSVTVKPNRPTEETISIGKGYVTVNAPEDAVIFMDGRRVGTTSVKDFALYEGNHKVLVKVGEAKWSESFSIRPDERMDFNVESQ